MHDKDRKKVPDLRSDVLKEVIPQGPSAHPRNTEYPSILLPTLGTRNIPVSFCPS